MGHRGWGRQPIPSGKAGLGHTYSAGSARGKRAVLTSLFSRKVEGKDRGGYVFCRGRERGVQRRTGRVSVKAGSWAESEIDGRVARRAAAAAHGAAGVPRRRCLTGRRRAPAASARPRRRTARRGGGGSAAIAAFCSSRRLLASVDDADAAAIEGGKEHLAFEIERYKIDHGVGAFKSQRMNIWDSGASCGNFVSLDYAIPGSVRTNTTKVSTANGFYQPPKVFDAKIPVVATHNHKQKTHSVVIKNSFLNEQCPHNLLPPGMLAHEQGIGTWIAPYDQQSYIRDDASHRCWRG